MTDPALLERNQDPGVGVPAPNATRRGRRLAAKIVLGSLAFVILAAILLRVFVLASFYTPSSAMAPTLKPGDRILVNRLAYRSGHIERGDIVVFKRPPGETDTSIANLVKRVVGLPGDEVSFNDGGVLVNGAPLLETYLPAGVLTKPKSAGPVIKVPVGQVLVLGDNRENSFDGRSFGPFDTSLIVGKVIYTLKVG